MHCSRSQTLKPFRVLVAQLCLVLASFVQADCTLAGTGRVDAPYEVGTYVDLQQVGTTCDLGASYRLIADIDASPSKRIPRGFTPIGRGSFSLVASSPFTGAFHGAGHVVRNLFINDSSDQSVGLFGYVAGATIDSLGLIDVEISGTVSGTAPSTNPGRPSLGSKDTAMNQAVVGGAAGMTDTGSSVEVVFVTGAVTGSPAGGIVGTNMGIVKNAFSQCLVASRRYAGSIVGQNQGVIATSYVAGLAGIGNSPYGGGVSGLNVGSVQSVYWNSPALGQIGAFGVDIGIFTDVMGLTLQQTMDSANFRGFAFAQDSAWSILQGQAAPVLRAFAARQLGILASRAATPPVQLRRTGRSTEIVLPFAARISVVDATGRHVVAETGFSAGVHSLEVPAGSAMLFVQVRSGVSTTTLPLEPVR